MNGIRPHFAVYAAAGFFIGLLTLHFIWPGRFDYYRVGEDFYRVNRLTGLRETAAEEGWKSAHEVAAEISAHRQQELDDQDARVATALADARAGKIVRVDIWHDRFQIRYQDGEDVRIDLSPYFSDDILDDGFLRMPIDVVDRRFP